MPKVMIIGSSDSSTACVATQLKEKGIEVIFIDTPPKTLQFGSEYVEKSYKNLLTLISTKLMPVLPLTRAERRKLKKKDK